jgi:hypothetical protein
MKANVSPEHHQWKLPLHHNMKTTLHQQVRVYNLHLLLEAEPPALKAQVRESQVCVEEEK